MPVKTYILAKDGNRPFLISRALADGAKLEIILNTEALARIPSSAELDDVRPI